MLEPNDYENLALLARTLNDFERHGNHVAEPSEWDFSRDDYANLIARLAARLKRGRLRMLPMRAELTRRA